MTVLNRLRATVEKRVAYNRTRYELSHMPLNVAIDLGMFREDADKVASKAVYG